jgi:hypothetical protein
MPTKTEELIRSLGENLVPVRPLRHPWIRTAAWLVPSLSYVAVTVLIMSPRSDLLAKLLDARFVVEQLAALMTGILAAVAAFAMVVPGYSRRLFPLLLLPAAVWLGSLGRGCVQDWLQLGPRGLSLRPDWMCLPVIFFMGAVPAIVMAIMLRRGAPLAPHVTAALGGIAAAGIGNFGLRLSHPEDVSVMVLVWQVGTVCGLSVLSGWMGRYLLNWNSIASKSYRRIAID